MRPDKMVIGSPVLGVQEQVLGRLSERPSLAHERGDTTADRQIHSLNEGRLNRRFEAIVSEQLAKDTARSPEHTSDREGETIALFALDQLAVEEIVGDVPVITPCSFWAKPVAEVGGDGVEVAAQTIAGEGGYTLFVQTQM